MSHPLTRQLTTRISYQAHRQYICLPFYALCKNHIHETCQLSIDALSRDKRRSPFLDISGMAEEYALFS